MSQMHVEKFYMPIIYCTCVQYIPMAEKFGRLLKLWRLAECTLVVEQILAITIFIEKWLNECVGNLNRPWTSFDAVRTKLMMKCDWKLYKSMLYLILDFLRWICLYRAVCVTFLLLASQLIFHLWCLKLFGDKKSLYAAVNGELYADDEIGVSSCRPSTLESYDFAIMMTSHCEVYWRIAIKTANPPE